MKYAIFLVIIALLIAACSPQGSLPEKDPAQNAVQQGEETKGQEITGNIEPNTQKQAAEKTGITASDLALHNTEKDCWVAYEGKVYDVTVFLPLHPGGVEPILKYCGTASEFEQGFTKKHGTSKVNILLQQIYKGELA